MKEHLRIRTNAYWLFLMSWNRHRDSNNLNECKFHLYFPLDVDQSNIFASAFFIPFSSLKRMAQVEQITFQLRSMFYYRRKKLKMLLKNDPWLACCRVQISTHSTGFYGDNNDFLFHVFHINPQTDIAAGQPRLNLMNPFRGRWLELQLGSASSTAAALAASFAHAKFKANTEFALDLWKKELTKAPNWQVAWKFAANHCQVNQSVVRSVAFHKINNLDKGKKKTTFMSTQWSQHRWPTCSCQILTTS